MSTLKVSSEMFLDMLQGLIKSGVGFDSVESDGWIVITFKGSY